MEVQFLYIGMIVKRQYQVCGISIISVINILKCLVFAGNGNIDSLETFEELKFFFSDSVVKEFCCPRIDRFFSESNLLYKSVLNARKYCPLFVTAPVNKSEHCYACYFVIPEFCVAHNYQSFQSGTFFGKLSSNSFNNFVCRLVEFERSNEPQIALTRLIAITLKHSFISHQANRLKQRTNKIHL